MRRPEPYERPDTILQRYAEDEHVEGAVTPPIFQTSLFVFPDCESFAASFDQQSLDRPRYVYSRVANPTCEIAERKIAALEHMGAAKLFGSGMGAISAAIMSCVKAGDHVVCIDTVYGPTKEFLRDYLPQFGVTTTFVPGSLDDYMAAATPETTCFYLESPSSILFRIQDLEAIAAFAKSRGIATIIDNSYCSPYFQQPADFGIDIVVHSATKYIAGHSDVVAGALATSEERMRSLIAKEVSLFGGALAPMPAWLLLRGLRTLGLRMKHARETGRTVAHWLRERPEVSEVFFPGFDDHPSRDLAEKQMQGTGSLLTFAPKVQDEARLRRFANDLKMFQLGVSWGGYESLCVFMPQHPVDWPEPRWVVRLYCGLEDVDDLLGDLDRCLQTHLMP